MKKPKRRDREPKRWWSWPPPRHKPPEEWTDEELSAVSVHPCVTGFGVHPRTVSDEDWAASVLARIKELGEWRFWMGFISLLHASASDFGSAGQTEGGAAVGNYPTIKTSLRLPMPSVALNSGDHGWETGKWTPEMVRGITCNPVLTGMPPFPELVPRKQWVDTMLKLANEHKEEGGMVQVLVNVLFCLRRTYGCPGQPHGVVPFGYVSASDDEDDDVPSEED